MTTKKKQNSSSSSQFNGNNLIKRGLANFLLDVAQLENRAELLRQELCSVQTFEPYQAFCRLIGSKGDNSRQLMAEDISAFMFQNNLPACQDYSILYITQHQNGIQNENPRSSSLIYLEFLASVMTKDKPHLRTEVALRQNFVLMENERLPFQVETKLANLLQYEIQEMSLMQHKLQNLLRGNQDFDFAQAFQMIDGKSLGYIDFDSLHNFFLANGFQLKAQQIVEILKRVNKNQSRRVSFQEFQDYLNSFLVEQKLSPNNFFKTSYVNTNVDDKTAVKAKRKEKESYFQNHGDFGQNEQNQDQAVTQRGQTNSDTPYLMKISESNVIKNAQMIVEEKEGIHQERAKASGGNEFFKVKKRTSNDDVEAAGYIIPQFRINDESDNKLDHTTNKKSKQQTCKSSMATPYKKAQAAKLQFDNDRGYYQQVLSSTHQSIGAANSGFSFKANYSPLKQQFKQKLEQPYLAYTANFASICRSQNGSGSGWLVQKKEKVFQKLQFSENQNDEQQQLIQSEQQLTCQNINPWKSKGDDDGHRTLASNLKINNKYQGNQNNTQKDDYYLCRQSQHEDIVSSKQLQQYASFGTQQLKQVHANIYQQDSQQIEIESLKLDDQHKDSKQHDAQSEDYGAQRQEEDVSRQQIFSEKKDPFTADSPLINVRSKEYFSNNVHVTLDYLKQLADLDRKVEAKKKQFELKLLCTYKNLIAQLLNSKSGLEKEKEQLRLTLPDFRSLLQGLLPGQVWEENSTFLLFQRYDLDKDGELSEQELYRMLQPRECGYRRMEMPAIELNTEARAALIQLMQLMVDNEGVAEIVRKKISQHQQQLNTYEMFKMLDQNKDGVISLEDIASVYSQFNVDASTEDVTLLLRRFDRNGDSVVSFSEFVQEFSPKLR